MANLNDTLDSLLRKYYHENTPANEKEACLTVFNRKCKSNNINADSYKQNYEDRNIKKKTNTQTKSGTDWGSSSGSSWKYQRYKWGPGGFEEYDYDDIFRSYRNREEPRHKEPDFNSYEYNKQHATIYGKFKECMYEAKMDHIRINCLRYVEGRWAIDNLIFYCGDNPKKVVKELEKYKVFTFTSNGKRYFGQFLNISRLWGYKSAKEEVPIY